jgi:ubiquinone/menaquinone biosynthesis C-methylase UbiE
MCRVLKPGGRALIVDLRRDASMLFEQMLAQANFSRVEILEAGIGFEFNDEVAA